MFWFKALVWTLNCLYILLNFDNACSFLRWTPRKTYLVATATRWSKVVFANDGYLVLNVTSGGQLKCQRDFTRTSNGCFLHKCAVSRSFYTERTNAGMLAPRDVNVPRRWQSLLVPGTHRNKHLMIWSYIGLIILAIINQYMKVSIFNWSNPSRLVGLNFILATIIILMCNITDTVDK